MNGINVHGRLLVRYCRDILRGSVTKFFSCFVIGLLMEGKLLIIPCASPCLFCAGSDRKCWTGDLGEQNDHLF